MSLTELEKGRNARLVRIAGGRRVRARLAAMGLVPGVELKILQRHRWGPYVIAVNHTRMMLGPGMASKIIVA